MNIYSLLAANVVALERFPVGFFESLVVSRYGIPRERLANGTRKDDAIAAIKRQHGIASAQTISGGAGNPVSTYVLMVLLSAISVLNIFVTWSSERSGYGYAMPKAPGSIAAVVGLLADSAILRSRPEGC
ncbi:hypothetical protein DL768_001603 [Monosporascus sp. mg162]|nr:hypothetical protein DL768_001603 [Monosporascus sp. mg162]